MKKITDLVLLFVGITMLVSCDDVLPKKIGPQKYQNEIEDYVTAHIAVINTMLNDYRGMLYDYQWDKYIDDLGHFRDDMFDEWKGDSPLTFEEILKKYSNKSNYKYRNIAQKVYKEYKTTTVIISQYKEIQTSSKKRVWEFKELNTGICYKFILSDDGFLIDINEKSLDKYIEENE